RLRDFRGNKQLFEFAGHEGPVTCIAFSADRSLAVTGGEDKTMLLWDMTAGQLKGTCAGHRNPVVSVAITPDGSHAASAYLHTTVPLWDLKTSEVRRLENPHGVASVVFSPDGKRLFCGLADMGTLQEDAIVVWDVETGKEMTRFQGDAGTLTTLSVSP